MGWWRVNERVVPSLQYSKLSVPACTSNRWPLYECSECCMTATAMGLSPRSRRETAVGKGWRGGGGWMSVDETVKVWQGWEKKRILRCWWVRVIGTTFSFSMTVWRNEADHSSAVNRDISVIPNAPTATESHGEQNSREATLTSTPQLPLS